MISKIEMRRDRLPLIATKMIRADVLEAALDRVVWKEAVKQMTEGMRVDRFDTLGDMLDKFKGLS
jgi:hypothetical protein